MAGSGRVPEGDLLAQVVLAHRKPLNRSFCSVATRTPRFATKNRNDGRNSSHQDPVAVTGSGRRDRANAIVSTLDSDDRALLAKSLDEISSALHFELLQKLYLRYPGLAETGEGWDGTVA